MGRPRPVLNAAVGVGVAVLAIHLAGAGHPGVPGVPAATHAAAPRTASVTRPAPGLAAALAYGAAQAGKPYLWGGGGPAAWDCSALAQAVWARAGVAIPRTSQEQWRDLRHVTRGQLRPGDLVFEHGYLMAGEDPPGHVAVYLGGGRVLEAYDVQLGVRVTALRPGAWGYARPGK